MEIAPRFESLTDKQVEVLDKLANYKIPVINWDFDQTLVDSEIPVKQRYYELTGLDFRDRKIDRYAALSHWTEIEGSMPFDQASLIEFPIWRNSDVLSKATPITQMQEFSKKCNETNIIQTITTAREPELRQITLDTIEHHFPWFTEKNLNIRFGVRTPSEPFKGVMSDAIDATVCFEDSITSTRQILKFSNAYVILFPKLLERGMFQGNERVIEFSNFESWGKTMYLFSDI